MAVFSPSPMTIQSIPYFFQFCSMNLPRACSPKNYLGAPLSQNRVCDKVSEFCGSHWFSSKAHKRRVCSADKSYSSRLHRGYSDNFSVWSHKTLQILWVNHHNFLCPKLSDQGGFDFLHSVGRKFGGVISVCGNSWVPVFS